MKVIVPSIVLSAVFCFGTSVSPAQSVNTSADSVYTYRNPSVDGIGKYYLGREIAHTVSGSATNWLERDNREQEENSNLAIEKMLIKPDDVIADIGAGSGYYSFKIAEKVPNGKVFAEDVQDEMINYLNDRKRKLNSKNVEVIKGTTTSVNLPPASVNLAIMVDVYHELEYPRETLKSIKNVLKPGGRLLLIEYRAEDPSVHRNRLHKTSVKQLNKELEANGFELSYRGEFLPIQHFLIYKIRR